MQYATHKREHQQLEQLWFPGTHSDLSGVPKSSHVLANHALRWMMTKAQDCGMVFRYNITYGNTKNDHEQMCADNVLLFPKQTTDR